MQFRCEAPKERQRIAHCKRNHEVMKRSCGIRVIDRFSSSEGATANGIRLWLKVGISSNSQLLSPLRGLVKLLFPLSCGLTPTATCYRRSTAPLMFFEPSFRIAKSTLFQIVCALCNHGLCWLFLVPKLQFGNTYPQRSALPAVMMWNSYQHGKGNFIISDNLKLELQE